MANELPPLSSLDQDAVDQETAQVVARVQEDDPSVDVRRGPILDYVLRPHGVLAAALRQRIDAYLRSRSLLDLANDPDLAAADPTAVDAALSNFRVARRAGSAAGGEVTIVRSTSGTVTIPRGAAFTGAGLGFHTDDVYTAKREQALVNGPNDRLITQLADGTYAFTVPVVADAEGPAYELPKDTLVVPAALPTNYLTSYATSTFVGGRAPETNDALLARLQVGPAARGPSNRPNTLAAMGEQEAFAGLERVSIVGLGDAEMRRDRHWIWPSSGGGRVDLYVRTQPRLEVVRDVRDAVLVAIDADGAGVWQASFGRDAAAGVYEVREVRRADAAAGSVAGGFTVVADERVLDLTGPGFVPDVLDLVEGAYSRYQAVTVRFRDTLTPVTAADVGLTGSYDFGLARLPLIADLQDWWAARDVRACAADALVRAPVPVFVTLRLTVYKRGGDPDPDVAGLRDALADEVNRTAFVGKVFASRLQDVAHGYLADGMSVSAIDMLGRVRYPDGATEYVRSSEVLAVPHDPDRAVSALTAQFFAAAADVGVSVVAAAAPV